MPRRPSRSLPFRSWLRVYQGALRVRHASSSLEGRAKSVLPRLFSHLREQGVRDLRTVKEEHLLGFVSKLRASPGRNGTLAPWSLNAYTATLRSFFACLHREERLLVNPAQDLPLLPGPRLARAVPSEAEVARLVLAPAVTKRWPDRGLVLQRRDQAILETLYGTGLRRSECLRLDVRDLDLAAGTLLVRNGKGRKDRVVPIPLRALMALDLYLQEARPRLLEEPREEAVFLSHKGKRLGVTGLRGLLLRHTRAAGIARPLSVHSLRHAYATHLLRRGADVRHIQELLGHRAIETTELYTRVGVEDLRQVLRRSHPRRAGLIR